MAQVALAGAPGTHLWAALAAQRLGDDAYQRSIVDLAEFYSAHVLPQAAAWALAARDSAALCVDFDAEAL